MRIYEDSQLSSPLEVPVLNWVLLSMLSAASAGLIPILAKRGGSQIDPTLATALRSVVMAACLLTAAALLGRFRQLPTLTRPALNEILLTGFACAASTMCFFFALRFGPAAKVVAIDRMSVAVTFLLAACFLGESWSWRGFLGVGMIVMGVFITTRPS